MDDTNEETIQQFEFDPKSMEINDKRIDVYEFVGEGFFDDGRAIGRQTVITHYDVNSGFLVFTSHQIKMSDILSGTSTIGFNLQAIDISKPTLAGGCLIATATYGSELAPQVQQLRELRDNYLLKTESGTSFMTGFNQFYYSFSPTIADLERESPIFKEAVNLTITPLITSLSILNYVDMDSEAEVLGYGIGLILLNVGMYIITPVVIGIVIARKV